MSTDRIKVIDYALRKLCDSHRVDLVIVDGSHVQRGAEPALEFRLRSRPWVHRVLLADQDLLFARTPTATLDLVADGLALGASRLRGAIFRDLLLNTNDYPVDFLGDTSRPEETDKVLQDAENTATRLMLAVDLMRKERP